MGRYIAGLILLHRERRKDLFVQILTNLTSSVIGGTPSVLGLHAETFVKPV
jgi:hypothetical protein